MRISRINAPRSIPAGAGETGMSIGTRPSSAVDPRGCGGDAKPITRSKTVWGRSPRVRGRPLSRTAPSAPSGSIPAGAGETVIQPSLDFFRRVDPRGCGGDRACAMRKPKRAGRSPRVRGRLESMQSSEIDDGSIPAGAGETPKKIERSEDIQVDPRGCGGDLNAPPIATRRAGRSPRVRGRL